MSRYLKDEDLGWVRVYLRGHYQALAVAHAIEDFCDGLRVLSDDTRTGDIRWGVLATLMGDSPQSRRWAALARMDPI